MRTRFNRLQAVMTLSFATAIVTLIAGAWNVLAGNLAQLDIGVMRSSRGGNQNQYTASYNCNPPGTDTENVIECDGTNIVCMMCSGGSYEDIAYVTGGGMNQGIAGNGSCGNRWLGTCNFNSECMLDEDGDTTKGCDHPPPGTPSRQYTTGPPNP